jgi:hypothetical protein
MCPPFRIPYSAIRIPRSAIRIPHFLPFPGMKENWQLERRTLKVPAE